MTSVPLLSFVLAAVGPAPGAPAPGPAGPCLAQALPTIDQAASRADTLALAQRYLENPPEGDRDCGALLSGMLQGLASTPSESEGRQRLEAASLVEAAIRNNGDEPRLYLAMANLLYNRQGRIDAMRMIDRALERRDRTVPLRAHEIAFAHYLQGQVHADAWRDWRSYGQLVSASEGQWRCAKSQSAETESFSSSSNDNTWLLPVNQLCPDVFARNMDTYFQPRANLKQDELDALEKAYREALEADSAYVLAARALLGEWIYLRDWEKAGELATAMQARDTGDYRPYLYLGLVAHETGRDSLAALQFGNALMRVPDSTLAALDDVTPLLVPAQLEWLQGQTEAVRSRFRSAFWNSLDPLYLTPANERKLEHYSRVVAADLMFSSPALGEIGSASFAGQMWIRYGRPQHMWELGTPGGRVVFWDYGPGPDVTFIRGTAYRSYRPSDEAVALSTALAKTTPQIYSMDAVADSVIPLGTQVVRIIADGTPEVLIHAGWPAGVPVGSDAGFTMLDPLYQPVAQWRGRVSEKAGMATTVGGLGGGTYSLTVEVWDRAARRLYRVRDTVTTLSLADSAFLMSDLLLAAQVRPLAQGEATSFSGLDVTPLYAATIRPGQEVGLLWETYRLTGERDGRIRYHVTLEVLDAGRQRVVTRVLRGIGLSGERRPEARIEYDSNRPIARGRAVEWLAFTGDLKAGEYRVVLHILDGETGREITRERALQVR